MVTETKVVNHPGASTSSLCHNGTKLRSFACHSDQAGVSLQEICPFPPPPSAVNQPNPSTCSPIQMAASFIVVGTY